MFIEKTHGHWIEIILWLICLFLSRLIMCSSKSKRRTSLVLSDETIQLITCCFFSLSLSLPVFDGSNSIRKLFNLANKENISLYHRQKLSGLFLELYSCLYKAFCRNYSLCIETLHRKKENKSTERENILVQCDRKQWTIWVYIYMQWHWPGRNRSNSSVAFQMLFMFRREICCW